MASKKQNDSEQLARQPRERTRAAEKAMDKGLAASDQALKEIRDFRRLLGSLKDKTDGTILTIEEINEAIEKKDPGGMD